ncbi:MAG TPA: glycosyltransferase family 4 protein [Desulfobulbaceae bacterium]|nr:glycosyltransferase family 4 protein [Desulfobulbaceae bacterium]
MIVMVLFLITIGSTWLLTALLRRYALSRSLIDIPNKRSSHMVPTPRGGGLAFVFSFLTMTVVFYSFNELPMTSMMALVGAGIWIAFVGFLDDHSHIAARWRLLAHFAGAVWVLIWLDGLPPLPIFGSLFDFGKAGNVLAVVYLVWLLNLYNFMDGIDGIASIETITVCLGAGVLAWLIVSESRAWLLPLLLASAVSGFLFWNFPRARIFMGDGGSGFLGITLGIFSIDTGWIAHQFFWVWVILLGVFNVDATVTLLRRLSRGEKFYIAHRDHAYQHAVRKFGGHRQVSLAVGALNAFWLFPLSMLVALNFLDGITGLALAYIPLIWLAFKFKAGVMNPESL